MKKIMKFFLFTLILGSFFTLLGCGNKEEEKKKEGSASEVVAETSGPSFGGNLMIGIAGAPYNLAVWNSNDINSTVIMDAVLPGLLQMDKDGNKVPYIAKSVEMSDGGKTFTVEIHDGLKWHDGAAFTTDDLKFTAEYIVKHKLGYGGDIYSAVESIETPSPTKIIYHLKNPKTSFFDEIGYWVKIMPKHIYEGVEDPYNFKFNGVGYGPYKIDKIEEGQYYTLKKVENWPLANDGKGAYLDSITYRIFPDSNSLLLALKKGEVGVSASALTVAAKNQLASDKGHFKVIEVPSLGYGYFGFNYKNKVLNDVNVRKAIAMTVDRDAIVKIGIQGGAVKMEHSISPVFKDLLGEDIKFPKFDVEGANKLLDESGYVDGNGDGVREDKDGNPIEFELIYKNITPNIDSIGNIFKSNVEKLGIKVTLKPVDPATYTDRVIKQKDFDINAIEWGVIDGPDSSLYTVYHSSASLNFMGYKNDKIDKALVDLQTATPESRMDLLNEFQREFVKELPVVDAWVRTNAYGGSNKYVGWEAVPGLYGPLASAQIVKVYESKK